MEWMINGVCRESCNIGLPNTLVVKFIREATSNSSQVAYKIFKRDLQGCNKSVEKLRVGLGNQIIIGINFLPCITF